jgi:hypothetical protein
LAHFKVVQKPDNAPRIHPLLLSLCLELNKPKDMSGVSEDNDDVVKHPRYTAPEEFPLLEKHISEINSACPESVSNPDGITYTLAVNCRKCVPLSNPPKTSPTERNVEISPKDKGKKHCRTSSSSIVLSPKHKAKRHRRISSGSTQGNYLIHILAEI